MKFARMLTPLAVGSLVIGLLALAGCDKAPSNAATTSAAAPAAGAGSSAGPTSGSVYDTVAAKASGFTVGNMMATRVVYVMFDPQCPHCGRLWETSKPLLGQVRMIWSPVRFAGETSGRQGAALLGAKDPATEMDAHERSLDAKRGGLVPPSDIPADLVAKVAANTNLMREIGAGSVPFIVYKNPTTGQSASFEGSMETADLKKLLAL
jgi:thiol:disulfide interchange protein DsbG